ASLAIPADRKAILIAELVDHVASATEAAVKDGVDPEVAARTALGNLESLRRSLEAIEPAFRITRWHAIGRGVIAGVLVAILLDQGGQLMMGMVGALVAIAIAAALAPPRVLSLLRAELRAPRVRGAVGSGIPIGPALAYGYTVMSVPFIVWTAMIVVRAFRGITELDVPLSSFAVAAAVILLFVVEGIRARRHVTA
ncbi:MAG TPA: hypothetical protein VGO00_04190, partial [Kofleriaceae bacterium]|nr:hypothetical protein [Kofleriaceae bacterium]